MDGTGLAGGKVKRRTITKTSLFPAAKEEVFEKLKTLGTLQYVAAPLASFSALDGGTDLIWRKGEDFAFRLKLFGFLPLGIHTIHVVEFDAATCQILTHESNQHVPIWNHRILLEPIQPGVTRYTDDVEIDAGWKTPIVCAWAKCFYVHRQKRWRKLLAQSNPVP